MRLPETVEWGVHSCLALAMLGPQTRISARLLAEYHGLKPAYLAKALRKLVLAGIVNSTEGRNGGLSLGRPADQITVLQIVQALDVDTDFFRCTEIRQQGPCAAAKSLYRKPCRIAQLMRKADAAWRAILAEAKLSDLQDAVAAEPIEGVGQATWQWLERAGVFR